MIDAHLHLWSLDTFVTGGVRPYSWLGQQHGALFRSFGDFPRHLGATVRLARELPGLTVVLDHLGKPPLGDPDGLELWRTGFSALGSTGNAVAKLSGLHLPVLSTRRTLEVLLELVSALSPDEQAAILEGTAIRAYGL
ncbi:amidohydrolase family protein [Paenarthrobacter sp. NPDC089989]|uniref:amidohydrolase family protein n=1 Tax=unclassified Paenarthrobacter TaxID=2634190 RepID=UPI0037F3FF5F